jgi:hypothetical protein
MFYDLPIAEYGDINYKINKKYCDRHNIDIICEHEKMHLNRHSAWERLPLILKHIDNYDYIIWIDADAFFYYNERNICEIIKEHFNENINFIFSKDINCTGNDDINTGFFIVKNTQFSKDFINKWSFDEELYNSNPYPKWWDQGVLIDMYRKNIMNIIHNSISLDYGTLQHFVKEEIYDVSYEPYVLHLSEKSREERIETSSVYLELLTGIEESLAKIQ